MELGVSDIVGMTARAKADLFAKGAKQVIEGRRVATIALAELDRSRGYLDLGFASVQELAAELSTLDEKDVTQMLWVGRKLLEIPELKAAFQENRLCWSKVRSLVPHITKDNAAEWIPKAIRMTSNDLERQISTHRNPSVNGPTHAMYLSLPCYQRLSELANGVRLESGKKYLSDQECLMRLLDELETKREAESGARASGASATTSAPSPAAPAAVMAAANEQVVVPLPPGATQSRHIPAAIRRKLMIRARYACEIETCRNVHGLVVHHAKVYFSEGGPPTLANLEVLCHLCHEKLHKDQRRAASPAVDACEPAAGDPAPVRNEDPDGGEEVPAENSFGAPARDSADLACLPGHGAPLGNLREKAPSRSCPQEGASDAPSTKPSAGIAHPGGP